MECSLSTYRPVSLILFLSVISSLSIAQQTISGKIEDKILSIPLIGVTVDIRNTEDSVLHSTSSNRLGIFTFKNIPKGSYILHATNLGYQAFQTPINLLIEDIQTHIMMEPGEIALEEIEITASPAVSLRGDTTEFDAKRFSTREYADADELVAQIPGVELDEEGNV